ncbi:type II toxin-antitoxin system VapC family toxin [Sphingobacterium phlebotomi]|uniref:Type II toxin-antitoxin system VapC family toxin n=1 Tax=Sphingobacterium phlebotomi TaxID=2605433 RepID=A0A5D4H1M9_9SPHI|nr:type II toxin-antitoxin system VapC family toxin [Sphingobacterium phlebotomi]TYR34394.1 type II toxin-antitoxin system VapC family toxin [Sphingobacterium phlebotomi]
MGQYLLDTHVLLWMQDDSDNLPADIKTILSNAENDLYISIASLWEIVIKKSLGKLLLGYSIEELVQSCTINYIIILPIQPSFLTTLEKLSFHHRDPFDRIIAATAIDLNYQLISKDANLKKYPLSVVW